MVAYVLSGSRDEDVTETMYRETYDSGRVAENAEANGSQKQHFISSQAGKVNRICRAFLDVLKKQGGHTQNLISAFVCQQPPNLEDGLRQIAELRGMLEAHVSEIC